MYKKSINSKGYCDISEAYDTLKFGHSYYDII